MSIKKLIRLAAVGAIAVVGSVGTVNAQATPVPASPRAALTTVNSRPENTITLSHEVTVLNELIGYPKTLTNDGIKGIDPTNIATAGASLAGLGNIGYFEVKTNAGAWDVQVEATNKGKLLSGVTPLKAGGTDVVLQAAVGLLDPTSTTTTPVIFTGTIPATINLAAATPVSLATALSTGANATKSVGTLGTLGNSGTDIGDVGFAATGPAGQKFFVNVGLNAQNPSGNLDGTYEETLTFVLYSIF